MDQLTYIEFIMFFSGIAIGIFTTMLYHRKRLGNYRTIAKNITNKAEENIATLHSASELDIKKRELEHQQTLEDFVQKEKKNIHKDEERLKRREEKYESRIHTLEKKLILIEKRETTLSKLQENIDKSKNKLAERESALISELEKVSGINTEKARDILINKIADTVHDDVAAVTMAIKADAEKNAERDAAKILSTVINRLAVPCVSETTISTVSLPNDEMKGRIIGREGRNIRALEQATGVNIIIDDSPGIVVLSGFDPIRKHIAKHALTELVLDGRIHPTRIEEVVEKSRNAIGQQIRNAGEDAALRMSIIDMHPELVNLLGQLQFRFSYGQNVLNHSIEVANIMGLIAAELKLDVALAKRIGILHDIGKAVSHEVEGTHATVGDAIAQKYGESPEVSNGIGCHHNDITPSTVEGSLCSAADALSAARPGARIEAIEQYIKRLKDLEDLAFRFPGVEKAYAMQAGREIRVIVLPDMIDDNGSINLARDIAKKIKTDISYPGKIKVTVIREKRSIEYAI